MKPVANRSQSEVQKSSKFIPILKQEKRQETPKQNASNKKRLAHDAKLEPIILPEKQMPEEEERITAVQIPKDIAQRDPEETEMQLQFEQERKIKDVHLSPKEKEEAERRQNGTIKDVQLTEKQQAEINAKNKGTIKEINLNEKQTIDSARRNNGNIKDVHLNEKQQAEQAGRRNGLIKDINRPDKNQSGGQYNQQLPKDINQRDQNDPEYLNDQGKIKDVNLQQRGPKTKSMLKDNGSISPLSMNQNNLRGNRVIKKIPLPLCLKRQEVQPSPIPTDNATYEPQKLKSLQVQFTSKKFLDIQQEQKRLMDKISSLENTEEAEERELIKYETEQRLKKLEEEKEAQMREDEKKQARFAQLNVLTKQLNEILVELQMSVKATYSYNARNYFEFIQEFTYPIAYDNQHDHRAPKSDEFLPFYIENCTVESEAFIAGLDKVIIHQTEFKNPRLEEYRLIQDAERQMQNLVKSVDSTDFFIDVLRVFDNIRNEFMLNLLDLDSLKRSLEKIINKCLEESNKKEEGLVNIYNQLQETGTPKAIENSAIVLKYIDQEHLFQEEAQQQTICEVIFQLYDNYMIRPQYNLDFLNDDAMYE
ncbi:Conserved_hypothetical protein [Hexamita inflata]|uniref:Uncharacterized protein n=1 Tax=Hexamita inflata TaxID=28002 RepID=A0AA86N833_9EUKA|nr:Conserved hypothetical protein [Hexamita inflata]